MTLELKVQDWMVLSVGILVKALWQKLSQWQDPTMGGEATQLGGVRLAFS